MREIYYNSMAEKISGIAEIKRGLEALFNYIIVEIPDGNGRKVDFRGLIDILCPHEGAVLEHDIYRENPPNRIYMVAKLAPFVTDDIMMGVFKKLPRGSSAYFYNPCRRGGMNADAI